MTTTDKRPPPPSGPDIIKDRTVWDFLERLARNLDSHSYSVVDHWDADLCAIGIGRRDCPEILVYVSTHGEDVGRYTCACELPEDDGGSPEECEILEHIDFDTLLSVIRGHLGLNP